MPQLAPFAEVLAAFLSLDTQKDELLTAGLMSNKDAERSRIEKDIMEEQVGGVFFFGLFFGTRFENSKSSVNIHNCGLNARFTFKTIYNSFTRFSGSYSRLFVP